MEPRQASSAVFYINRLLVFAPDESSAGVADQARPRILIVEDEYLAAAELKDGLADAGYEVVGIARTADQALALARSEKPLLAIMDIRLVGPRDGVDAALEIFSETGVRCIFATALHDGETRRRAESAAPLGWLPKPYVVTSVLDMVRRALAELQPPRQ